MPLLILKLLSRSGSLINPFQPITVRGFSKYTLIITKIFFLTLSFILESFSAYSVAAFTSCIEHGPTIIINLSSSLFKILIISDLHLTTVSIAFSDIGSCSIKSLGDIISFIEAIFKSSVNLLIAILSPILIS